MDNNQSHDKSDTNNPLNDVDKDDLTKTLFNDLNEPVLPVYPLASEPHSYSSLLGGQPSSAEVPLTFETTEIYSPPIVPLDGERQAHSFSLSLRHPRTELSGPHELSTQERSGNIFLSEQESLHALPLVNDSSGGEPWLDSVPPSHAVNENAGQSGALTAPVFASDTSPNLDKTPRAFNDRDLNDHDPIGIQTEPTGPIFGQDTSEMRDVNHSQRQPRTNGNTEGLHAARVLQEMMQRRRIGSPIISSQQSPFHHLLQQNQPEIGTPENLAYNALKETHVDPIACAPNAHVMPNTFTHSTSQANPPILSNPNVHTRAIPHTELHNVGNNSTGGSTLVGESQFPKRNSSSASTAQRTVDAKVLPDIVIDRGLLDKASELEKGLYKSPEFETFCQMVREKNMASGKVSIGGTTRRKSDLIKPNENLKEFGYPGCDGPAVQKILDTTPGLDRDAIEYLKLTVLCQLDRIRRGAREALHQVSAILIDQLRFRIMTQADILDLQCKVIDRFVVARHCVLERYSHYVKSRRWIENRSTNQRRGCLTHKQNNIMRMWLYRNFKNPYPDEEEKAYIVEETQLTMEQANNWLINARSRFWKPTMDYFEREGLERKMSVLITRRLEMTPETRVKALRTIGAASTHSGTRR